ncbi:unnamed protein product [Candida parapsilosis]
MDFPYVIYVVQNRGDDATVAAEEVGSGVVFHVKALLTGESLQVQEGYTVVFDHYSLPVPVDGRLDSVCSSSVVSKRRGFGIVYAIGLNTSVKLRNH